MYVYGLNIHLNRRIYLYCVRRLKLGILLLHSDLIARWNSRQSCAVQQHIDLIGHPVSLDRVKMLCKEDTRPGGGKSEEAIEIYKDDQH